MSILRIPRAIALGAIAALIGAASLVSFAESYRGLYLWALEHGLSGTWAVIWPLQVDVFIAVGELALFVALIDCWAARSRTAAWVVTGIGLAVSVAGNVGHVAGHSLASRVTAAVPPLAAAAALAVGLGVLKRITEQRRVTPGATRDTGTVTLPVTHVNGNGVRPTRREQAAAAGVTVRTIQRRRAKENGSEKPGSSPGLP